MNPFNLRVEEDSVVVLSLVVEESRESWKFGL